MFVGGGGGGRESRMEKKIDKLQRSVDKLSEAVRWLVDGQVLNQGKRSRWAQTGRRLAMELNPVDDAEELEE